MLRSDRTFIKGLLTESSKDTVRTLIKYFDLPLLLERTLTELYVEGLVIKQIAHRHSVDERTIKRYHAQALDMAEARVKMSLKGHFSTTTDPIKSMV